MRIVHYLYFTGAETGGPSRATIDLCTTLASRGHDAGLICSDPSGVPPSWADSTHARDGRPWLASVPVRHLPGKLLPPSARRRIGELLAGADIVHLHGVWDICNLQIAAEARSLSIPYIVSVRGMLDDWCMQQKPLKKRLFLALAVRRWLEGAAFVHLTAEAEHAQARKHFPAGRGIVIPNLTDLTPFRALPGTQRARDRFPALREGRPTLLFLSRIHVKKGLETLLRAAALLRARGIDADILIAGTGEPAYLESLRALAAGLGLTDRAHFLGLVTGEDKLSLYQASDLFVLPTSQENFGFVFIESLACGTPLVTTRGVDIWPELEAGGGARIAEPTPEAFANAVADLLSDRPRLEDMGRRGRAWVFEALDPDAVLSRFERMYESAADRAPAPHTP